MDVVCVCHRSNAKDGHIHEPDGSILCLHQPTEDGRDCPNAPDLSIDYYALEWDSEVS